MQTIKLINRPTFGHKRLYPDCDTSKAYLRKLNVQRSCFQQADIEFFESLGFTVEIEQPVKKEEPKDT